MGNDDNNNNNDDYYYYKSIQPFSVALLWIINHINSIL